MSDQDRNNISLLKKEIDHAWKIVDAAQEKERRARDTIQRLKGEIEKLSRLVDQGTQGRRAMLMSCDVAHTLLLAL